MTETLDLTLDHLAALGDALDGWAELVDGLTDEEAGVVRVALDDLLTQVRGAIGATDNRLINLLPVGQALAVRGGGQVIVEAKGKQTTHGSRLARAVAARVADTPADEDGVALPPAVLTSRTAEELVAVFALDNPSASFRATEVKKRNLNVSQFREFADGSPKVRFVR